MNRLVGLLGATALAALCGCGMTSNQNQIIDDAKAEGVVIQYYGDVEATLPLARAHCAAYERVAVRRSYSAEKNLVIYACVKP
jgi:ABC-type uncharacterized transport system auxiliary subunit